jgi:hypothetical protein
MQGHGFTLGHDLSLPNGQELAKVVTCPYHAGPGGCERRREEALCEVFPAL